MQVYHHEVSLEAGFAILKEENKHARLLRGKRINRPSGWNLYSRMEGQPIKCWHCGCEADRWISTKGRTDMQGHPDLNLFASTEVGVVLMTRDHIIPKSLGGSDDWRNMRPGCAPCNESRGNMVTKADIKFAQAHPELISQERIVRGLNNVRAAVKRLSANGKQNAAEIKRLEKPFKIMGYL